MAQQCWVPPYWQRDVWHAHCQEDGGKPSPTCFQHYQHLGPNSTPKDYLSLLDSAYDIVNDGDELFAKLLSTNQNSSDKPSSYLQRLQADLSKVIKRVCISANNSECQLLKQFFRGCWNNSLITTLQLEQKKDNPLSFTELLLLLRIEEDRQAAKSSQMKQHFGFSQRPKSSQIPFQLRIILLMTQTWKLLQL